MSREKRETLTIGPGAILRQRYYLEAEIGRGGMGIVYQARDLELQRQVAVKVLTETTQEARERIMREARAAAALNHPRIISVHDVGEEQGIPFFVMELVKGHSLAKQTRIELPLIVEIASQICAALDHAHSNNIVHRDLKPDNVLMSSSGSMPTVKLADLGLALPGYGTRISRTGLILGTASYMAPEQALGQQVDGRTDLYSLGVLLYELVTGRLPFSGDGPLAIVSQHVHAPVVPPRVFRPELPRTLESIILRLMEKNPADRFATARETEAALAECLIPTDTTVETDAMATVAMLDALSRGRLVGRVAELAETRELWRHTREGHGHAVLFSGEPGAGKTRLAREIMIQAAVDGAVVLSGGCYEYEATTPYLPFVEAFRRWVREQTDDSVIRAVLGDGAAQIAKLAPELETRLGQAPSRHELPPHEERLLFFDAVAQVFSNLAKRHGLLFFVDDLHWADHGTLWLLAHLLRQTRTERVLVVGCYRETELDRTHPLAKALVDWNRERLTTRITLRRFDANETSAQLGALLGENVSPEFGIVVHRETEGNPFFVEEVLKALIEQGAVRRQSGRWQRCDVGELVIPQSVKEAIGSRLSRVSEQSNEVLRVAAVLGKTFSFEELKVADRNCSEDALLDALDESAGAQLITAGNDDRFTFTHDKIREVLYEELNPIRRRRLHRSAAEGLEHNCVSGGCSVERLAYHYIHAGDYERGRHYANRAAVEAERVFAIDEAVAAYQRAGDCAEALGLTEEQLNAEEAIGRVYMVHGETIAAGEHFERALGLTNDHEVRARLQLAAAGSLVATGDQRGLAYVQQALTVLKSGSNPLETANALSIEARFHHLVGSHLKAIELLKQAAELVAPTADGDSVPSFAAAMISRIYTFLAAANQHLGLYVEADQWCQKAVEFGTTHKVLFAQAAGYEFLAEDSIHKGEFREGLGYVERGCEICDRLHSRERRAWLQLAKGMCLFFIGDTAGAERTFSEGVALAETIGERRAALLLKGNLAVTKADKANYISIDDVSNRMQRQRLLDEALQMALENFEAGESLGLLYTRFEARRCLAEVRLRRGELEEAERVCAATSELITPTESRVCQLWLGPLYMDTLMAAAENADGAGKPDEAATKRKLAREMLAHYQELVTRCQSPRFTREAERLAAELA